jgi:oligoribonuclease
MTGLNIFTDSLLEIAIVVSCPHSDRVLYEKHWVIATSQNILMNMDEWNTKQHTLSGLWQDSQESCHSLSDVEVTIITDLKNLGIPARKGLLCGNSIHQDRAFIKRLMPLFDHFLHYRQIDVSSIKSLWPILRPQSALFIKKEGIHRALSDVRESFEEYLYYKKTLSLSDK